MVLILYYTIYVHETVYIIQPIIHWCEWSWTSDKLQYITVIYKLLWLKLQKLIEHYLQQLCFNTEMNFFNKYFSRLNFLVENKQTNKKKKTTNSPSTTCLHTYILSTVNCCHHSTSSVKYMEICVCSKLVVFTLNIENIGRPIVFSKHFHVVFVTQANFPSS